MEQTYMVVLANEFGTKWFLPCLAETKDRAREFIADCTDIGVTIVDVQYTH